MNLPITGGCACGAIRYECTAKPLAMFQCHCRDCQRATGGACASIVLLPANALRFTSGTPRYHFTKSVTGTDRKRGFCAECGSRLTGAENREGTTGFVGVTAASLDDPSWFLPSFHIFVSDAQPWDRMDPGVPKYEQHSPT